MDIDYSLSVRDTFASFALACVENNMIGRILEAASVRQRISPSDDLPSWLPDWRLQPRSPVRPCKEPFNEATLHISFKGKRIGNALGFYIKILDALPESQPLDFLSRITVKGREEPGSSADDYIRSAISLCHEIRVLHRNTSEFAFEYGDENMCIFYILDRIFSFGRSKGAKTKDALRDLNLRVFTGGKDSTG
jgi:hypothetical protein